MFLKILFKESSPTITIIVDFILLLLTSYIVGFLFSFPELKINLNYYFLFSIFPIIILYISKSYNFLLRYTSLFDIVKIFFSLFFVNIILFFLIKHESNSLIFIILNFFISSSLLFSYRTFIKILFRSTDKNLNSQFNVLIYGAGKSGILTKRALYNNSELKVVGFVDDDKNKWNIEIDGIKIFGLNDSLIKHLEKGKIDKVIITTEKITNNRLKYLYNFFGNYKIQVLKIPPVNKWINGYPKISSFEKINIEDLLGRAELEIDIKKNNKLYNNKNLLVTGAAGSIGSEIVRQLINFKPSKIILVDSSETSMFLLKEDLDKKKYKINFDFHVCSITEYGFISKIFLKENIDIVFHAAAYKHVNMMEINPKSAVFNNVYGTKNLVDLSIINGIKKFIMISTDKAVNPTSVMGATKRICELYVSSKLNPEIETSFVCTRFGNVLGSNGSVVPIFTKQIDSGGPVLVTHPDIVRYFMTISEATLLVLEAGAISKGGEVYVFDMGKPVKIIELAKNMIIQSGLKPGKDIEIKFSGLRSGEKLFEELLVESEDLVKTHNKLIYISKQKEIDFKTIELIDRLVKISKDNDSDEFKIVKLMKEIVPEYKSNESRFQVLDNDCNNL